MPQVTGPFAPMTLRQEVKLLMAEFPRTPPPPHVPGLPEPEIRPALTIRQAMGSVPVPNP